MKTSEGGYREMESGLVASFLWSHDKSGKDIGRRWGVRYRVGRTCKSQKRGKRGEEEELVLPVFTICRAECYGKCKQGVKY